MASSWAIVASGPSLTAEDCEALRQSGLPTIAVNSSWKAARFAEVIYGGDDVWWQSYGHEIDIPARRVCFMRQTAARLGIEHHKGAAGSVICSGYQAIRWAMQQGAKRIILLGFDCSVARGTHWHGDHDKTGNPDARKAASWARRFNALAPVAKAQRVEIINCSRHTELTCFPVRGLESVLEEHYDSHVAVGG